MKEWLRDTAYIFFGFPAAIGIIAAFGWGFFQLWGWSHLGCAVIVWALFAGFISLMPTDHPPM